MDEDTILRAQHPLYDAWCRADSPSVRGRDWDLERKSRLENDYE